MTQDLLEDFKAFLMRYRESWNSCDVEEIIKHSSKDLKVRWADTESCVADWGYNEAKVGWNQAYTSYEGRNPVWHFEDIVTEINANQEGITVFWIRFEIDGSFLDIKMLFNETFQQENGEWKKVREYVELPINTSK
jgi:hypothetical protein